jgi:hypothetical protein
MFNDGGGCFAAWCALVVTMLPWCFAGLYNIFMNTVVMIEKTARGKSNRVALLGGWRVIIPLSIATISSIVMTVIGGIGTPIEMYAGNIGRAKIYWTVQCAGWTAFAGFSSIFTTRALFGFASFIEGVASNAVADAGVTHQHEMLAVAQRFRRSGWNTIFSLPIGLLLWALHAVVLPVYWYLAFLHVMNGVLTITAMWWLYSPTSQRRRLFPMCVAMTGKVESTSSPPASLTSAPHSPKSPRSLMVANKPQGGGGGGSQEKEKKPSTVDSQPSQVN